MATRDPVLRWAGYAQEVGKAHNVPPAILLGLTSVESGGKEGLVSSANARGITQFVPGTAAAYGVDVRPGHARNQLDGTARYLNALGFQHDPRGALAKYNGGPGNPQYGYADQVLAAAKRYGSIPAVTTTTAAATVADVPAVADASGGGLIDDTKRGQALTALTTAAFVIAGALLVYTGVNQASGGAVHRATKTAIAIGEMA